MCSLTCSCWPRGTNGSSQKQTGPRWSSISQSDLGLDGGWEWGWTFGPPWGTPDVCLLAASVEEFAGSWFPDTKVAKTAQGDRVLNFSSVNALHELMKNAGLLHVSTRSEHVWCYASERESGEERKHTFCRAAARHTWLNLITFNLQTACVSLPEQPIAGLRVWSAGRGERKGLLSLERFCSI